MVDSKRSISARKGWETRKKNEKAAKRRQAALKGARTRKLKRSPIDLFKDALRKSEKKIEVRKGEIKKIARRSKHKFNPKTIELNGNSWLLVEFPPVVRMLKFHTRTNDVDYIDILPIALPYTVMIYDIESGDLFLGFRKAPLNVKKLKDEVLYFPLLPNVYWYYRTCYGEDEELEFEELTHNFWQSDFTLYSTRLNNSTMWDGCIMIKNTFLKGFSNWSKLTREHGNPNFMIDRFDEIYKRPQYRRTIQDILEGDNF